MESMKDRLEGAKLQWGIARASDFPLLRSLSMAFSGFAVGLRVIQMRADDVVRNTIVRRQHEINDAIERNNALAQRLKLMKK